MMKKLLILSILFTVVVSQRQANNNVQSETLEERRNIGSEFPYRRGDTPIFNFDQGDEPFIDTIDPLIKNIYTMVDLVAEKREVTQAFGETFANCEDCKP